MSTYNPLEEIDGFNNLFTKIYDQHGHVIYKDVIGKYYLLQYDPLTDTAKGYKEAISLLCISEDDARCLITGRTMDTARTQRASVSWHAIEIGCEKFKDDYPVTDQTPDDTARMLPEKYKKKRKRNRIIASAVSIGLLALAVFALIMALTAKNRKSGSSTEPSLVSAYDAKDFYKEAYSQQSTDPIFPTDPRVPDGVNDIATIVKFTISGWGGADYYHGVTVDFENGYLYRNIEDIDMFEAGGQILNEYYDQAVVRLTDTQKEDIFNRLNEANISSWKEDYGWDEGVLDGYSWTMSVTYADGSEKTSHGYGVYSECTPKEYNRLYTFLEEIG